MKLLHHAVEFHVRVLFLLARDSALRALRTALDRNPVVVLVGPRQVGKTTLAWQIVPESSLNYSTSKIR